MRGHIIASSKSRSVKLNPVLQVAQEHRPDRLDWAGTNVAMEFRSA
jgi:hypothetical protein